MNMMADLNDERMSRLAAAVLLVREGDARGCKVSVRRAAAIFGVPKSTVHRHIQVTRGREAPRRARGAAGCVPQGSHKLRIGFLVHPDS